LCIVVTLMYIALSEYLCQLDFAVVCCTQRGCSPLHFAVRRRNVVSAMHLLGAGCHLDSPDMNGETPLHSAARDGLLSIVQTMCAYGCNVDVVNKVIS